MVDQRKNRFLSGKRLVLIVDDDASHRETLSYMLSEDYEVIISDHAEEALDLVREYATRLSLVILDIQTTGLGGLGLLRKIKNEEALRHIPVIVLTGEKSYEVQCLQFGASDFIKKPYDLPNVVLARVQRTIETAEDSYILENTEFDELTDLYHMEPFFQLVEKYDAMNPDAEMDAVSVDVSHFHMINELYGREVGNRILVKLAREIDRITQKEGGLACRKGADVFLLYLPHRAEYVTLLNRLQWAVTDGEKFNDTVKLKMGLYQSVEKEIDVRTRFDRAKLARDTIHNSFSQIIAFYDSSLHKKNLLSRQLMNEMDAALKEKQFTVYYQPKFSISGDNPVMVSAEALIRWHHPQLGVIYPGLFIPLFEEYGVISRLDHYVWRETARQIAEWRDKYGKTLPVSVNVSRADMFDPELVDALKGIVEEFKLDPADLIIEITESAYTENSDQIVEQVNHLRALGFKIEMDDFGSGYSSLNMLAVLPIDAIKLDMRFIHTVFDSEKNLHLLRMMMQIKDFLHVPIIAEGVETREQLLQLKAIGCDIAQGFYFSKPVPPEEFEPLVADAFSSQVTPPPKN
jgi:diguanylate cyclase (GGDEF)-like protein